MRRFNLLAIILSLLALIIASASGTFAAWTYFTDTVIVYRTGTQLMTQRTGEPCWSFGVWSATLQFGDGQNGPSGTCDDTLDFGVGRYSDIGTNERGLELQSNNRPVGISLNNNVTTLGIKMIDGDLWITDNRAGALHLLAKIKSDGAYEFPNGCELLSDGLKLLSTCHINQPLW